MNYIFSATIENSGGYYCKASYTIGGHEINSMSEVAQLYIRGKLFNNVR